MSSNFNFVKSTLTNCLPDNIVFYNLRMVDLDLLTLLLLWRSLTASNILPVLHVNQNLNEIYNL